MIGADDVREAAARIAPLIHRTPVMTCATLDRLAGCQVFLKCENLQRMGAFKLRGASNLIAQLSPAERARGVVTHSSGNHGQAVALAARLHGVAATVVLPENAAAVKRAAVEGYGARVVLCAPTLESREETVSRLVVETGALLVHPYDDPRIIAGQGTAALELLEQTAPLDALLAPVGGGGLLSGCAVVCVAQSPPVRVVGCEPELADDAHRSLAGGVRIERHTPRTVADGLLTCLGALPFEILSRQRVPISLVSERQILDAQRFLWERTKLVVEASSAVAVAPLLARALPELLGHRVGVILTGGNVDLDRFFA